MSTELARKLKALATGVSAAAFLFVQQSAADNNGINRFAVRNCTNVDVLICTYNKDDDILAIPYDANRIKPGDKKRASCGSANQCKAFSLVSSADIKKVTTSPEALALLSGMAGAGGLGGGFAVGLIVAAGTGVGSAMAIGPLAGAAIGAGGAIAVVKTIDAVNAGKTCDRALKDAKKAISDITDADAKKMARDAMQRTVAGSWPKYKNYSFVTQNGVPALVKGDKC
jgi:hypothetical protein